jgi:hypothetical protein
MMNHHLVSVHSLLRYLSEETDSLPTEAACTQFGLLDGEFGEDLTDGAQGVYALQLRRDPDQPPLWVPWGGRARGDVMDADTHAEPPETQATGWKPWGRTSAV